jgi:hypothetical protein
MEILLHHLLLLLDNLYQHLHHKNLKLNLVKEKVHNQKLYIHRLLHHLLL